MCQPKIKDWDWINSAERLLHTSPSQACKEERFELISSGNEPGVDIAAQKCTSAWAAAVGYRFSTAPRIWIYALTYRVTFKIACLVAPAYEAETVTDVLVRTRFVVTVNVAEVAPASIVTVLATFATVGLLEARFTTAPPEGAGALNVTVPCEELPPLTLVGFNVREDKVAALCAVSIA